MEVKIEKTLGVPYSCNLSIKFTTKPTCNSPEDEKKMLQEYLEMLAEFPWKSGELQLQSLLKPSSDPTGGANPRNSYSYRRGQILSVLRVVCHQTKVSKEDVLSKDRSARIVWPRQMAMYVLHKRLNWPMPLIGTSFEKHHTSVIHSCKIVEGRMETEPDKKEEVNEIMRLLTAELKSPEVLITY